MNEPIKLDKWDIELIKVFKNSHSVPVTVESLVEIWENRCALPHNLGYGHISHVNKHLLSLAKNINLFDSDYIFTKFIYDLRPECNGIFLFNGRPYLTAETNDFNLILLSRLDSLFADTLISRLPGYPN